ncbi:hypothetical protein [Actinoplanes sp. NPDC026619]|uniref:hypothetical protein n=1 Tax=Actinoplanes sp. NPDC026619 TaxID=3155798 RepID=UPI0033F42994
MWRVVTGMTNTFAVHARTALSPEWDHGFDEAFTDLVTSDPDWVRDEFDALVGANFDEPPPPAPPAGRPETPQPPPADRQAAPKATPEQITAHPNAVQRSPP